MNYMNELSTIAKTHGGIIETKIKTVETKGVGGNDLYRYPESGTG